MQRPLRLWTHVVYAAAAVTLALAASVAIDFAEGSELRSGARTFRLRRKKLSPD